MITKYLLNILWDVKLEYLVSHLLLLLRSSMTLEIILNLSENIYVTGYWGEPKYM